MGKISAKNLSLVEDKACLARRSHGWLTLSSYDKLAPQGYLFFPYTAYTKLSFLKLRMGVINLSCHLPIWKRGQAQQYCRLCGSQREDIIHILCLCPRMLKERRSLLRKGWVNTEVRTCRAAVLACFDPKNIDLNSALVRFMDRAVKKTRGSD